MNKLIQYLFLGFIPLYPVWAMIVYSITKRNINIFTFIIFIPVISYYIFTQKIKIPKYLIFFILFTVYHFCSLIINHLIPFNMNFVYFIISDTNLLACMIFLIIENTQFDDAFILKMNRLVFIIVIISLIVSIIQIKFPYFLISPEITNSISNLTYIEQGRNFSIFSWVSLNSLGISFPILISILLGTFSINKKTSSVAIISGLIVSFLSRARYVMISSIIVLSQLFFNLKIELKKKVYTLLIFTTSIMILIWLAKIYDVNIQQIIDTRVLEKNTGMASAKVRITSFEVFKIIFPEHPWLGVGPETRADVIQLMRGVAPVIHVGYLSYLYFYGFFGASLLFISFFYLLKNAWFVGKKHLFWGSFYGLVTLLAANFTLVYFNMSEMGIILALIYLKHFNELSASKLLEEKLDQHSQLIQ